MRRPMMAASYIGNLNKNCFLLENRNLIVYARAVEVSYHNYVFHF